MNFHGEHHMFPNVPFHALPALAEATKADFPPQYTGFAQAYREIWMAYRAQQTNPDFFVDRSHLLPVRTEVAPPAEEAVAPLAASNGWLRVADSSELVCNDVIRFDSGEQTFAVYRLADGQVRATDGLCSHAQVHLCGGLVRDGQIECPKHNGRFDIETGKAMSRPVKVDLSVHEAREVDGRIEIRPQVPLNR
jgi:Na+-transporting NADH:ubiquinone oxidoreductase subunit F